MRWLTRLLSSRVRELERQLLAEQAATDRHLRRWAEAAGAVSRLTAEMAALREEVAGRG